MLSANRRNDRRVRLPTHYPAKGRATTKEAQKFLRVGKTKLFEMLADGVFHRFLEGGKVFLDWEELWAHHRNSMVGIRIPGPVELPPRDPSRWGYEQL